MKRKLTLAVVLTFGCVLLCLAAANFFPDQTFRAITLSRTLFDGIISRISPMPSGTNRQVQEGRIYESLVREFVGSNHLDRTIFLRVAGADPNDELLARLRASGLLVRKASEAPFDNGFYVTRVWTDRATGRDVRMVDIGTVTWLFGDTVEVKGGVECGSLCGAGGIYKLVKRHGAWTVDECRSRWVS